MLGISSVDELDLAVPADVLLESREVANPALDLLVLTLDARHELPLEARVHDVHDTGPKEDRNELRNAIHDFLQFLVRMMNTTNEIHDRCVGMLLSSSSSYADARVVASASTA